MVNECERNFELRVIQAEILFCGLITFTCYSYNKHYNNYIINNDDYNIIVAICISCLVCYFTIWVFYKQKLYNIAKLILRITMLIMVGINFSYKIVWSLIYIPIQLVYNEYKDYNKQRINYKVMKD